MKRPLIMLMIITFLGSACGQMGPLHLPEESVEPEDKKEEASQ